MNVETDLMIAERLLEAHASAITRPEPNRLDASIDLQDLLQAVRMLVSSHWGYLAAITGVDPGVDAGGFVVLYHFCAGGVVVTLRVHIPRDAPAVPSVCEIVPSASFFERELIEMFGIAVEGTPDPSRLFLPDEWPDGVYPLRKDFTMETDGEKNARL